MRNYIKVTHYQKTSIDRAEGRELLLLFFDTEDAVASDAAYKHALEATGRDEKAAMSSFYPMPGYLSERDRIGTMLFNCGHWVYGENCAHCGR